MIKGIHNQIGVNYFDQVNTCLILSKIISFHEKGWYVSFENWLDFGTVTLSEYLKSVSKGHCNSLTLWF